jgi:tetratricopeptide (TPR) repeat protein
VRLSLAQAYIAARDLNGAIDTLAEVVDDNPRVAATLGQYLEQADRPAEAAKAYELALTVAPNNRDVKLRRIVSLYKAKQYQEAADAAATAQTQHPDDLRFVRIRAQALVETGARARAVEVLEGAAKANPTDLPTSFALAELYTKANRPADAERTARQLVERNPNNADAMNYLGYLLADRGEQLDEAIRLVRKALDLDPQNPSFLDSLGWAYFRQGKLEDAERYLGPAADKLPRNSTIQDHFGDVLARRGRWQDAISAWTRALNGDGDDIDRAAIEKKISDARARVR